jgi:hypothetical protein
MVDKRFEEWLLIASSSQLAGRCLRAFPPLASAYFFVGLSLGICLYVVSNRRPEVMSERALTGFVSFFFLFAGAVF